MLKFSGFADLTSCQGNGAETPMKAEPSTKQSSRQCARRRSVSCSQGEAHCIECIKGMKLLGAQTRMSISSGKNRHQQHETEDDTEVGMLSGVSRKRSIRSGICWFTEFCKSQCLSHFAAPFIVVRTETSIAESCELHMAIASDRRLHQSKLRYAVAVGMNGYVIHPAQPTTREYLNGGRKHGPTQASQKNSQECDWSMCE